MNIKRILALLIATILCISLCFSIMSCGDDEKDDGNGTSAAENDVTDPIDGGDDANLEDNVDDVAPAE